MTYPIYDWKDSSQYPANPLAVAPAAFVEKRLKYNYSNDEISSVFWHWEFLRRHQLYQHYWRNEGVEYFSMFGVCGTFRPDPKTDCPADILFRYELFNKQLRHPTMLDAGKPLAENEARLKLKYDFIKASKSAFELFMRSGYTPWPNLTRARKRRLGEDKYRNLLRVLDALADGEKLTHIARKLRPALPESALNLQEAYTGLPRMSKPDI